jgi:hypothetical protein
MTGQSSKLCIITELSQEMIDYLPHPDQGLPEPQPPTGGGGGGGGLPPYPSHPIYYPDAKPTHPIYLPPYIDNTLPGGDSGIGGGAGEHPDHTLPGDLPGGGGGGGELPPPVQEFLDNWEVKTGWTEDTGWVVVIVPKEDTLVPTPSRRG